MSPASSTTSLRREVRAAPAVALRNRREVLLVSDRVGNVQQHLRLGPRLDQFWVRQPLTSAS
jgi:hypothetical protein